MHPYRENASTNVKRLPRFRARLRGLYRRVILPTKVVCAIALAGALVDACAMFYVVNREDVNTVHFNDWQRELDRRQAVIDEAERLVAVKQGTVDMRLREVDFAKVMQMPLLIGGTYSDLPSDFHGTTVLNTPSTPIVCFLDRDNTNVTMKCVKSYVDDARKTLRKER